MTLTAEVFFPRMLELIVMFLDLEAIPEYLNKIADMGKTIKQFIRTRFEGIVLKPDPANLLDYLPTLSSELQQIIQNHGRSFTFQ